MNLIRMLLALAAFFISAQASAVMRVGNGGDVVFCSAEAGSPFQGYYSYDYLATYNLANDNADLTTATSDSYYLYYVSGVILRMLGDRHNEFIDFYKNVDNYTDRTQSRVWLARPGELIDVPNLPNIRQLPKNCQKMYQAVIRYQLGSQIVYEVNSEIMAALKERPLQLAFLQVHEFLWEIYPNPPDDAEAAQKRLEFTRFLFTRAATEWTPRQAWEYVSKLDLVPPGEIFKDYMTWADKYNPADSVIYHCVGEDAFGSGYVFDLDFAGIGYEGSSDGYFYQSVKLVSENGEITDLLKRPVDSYGLYVFKNGFDVQLRSENPEDGSFENNMSDQLIFRVARGGGKCRLIRKEGNVL